jgi:epoxyqueuosine reductase QueG
MKAKDHDTQKNNTEHLQKEARSLEMDLFGVASIDEMKKDFLNIDKAVLKDFNAAISMGVRLLKPVLDDIQDRPTPLYLHHYRQINYLLDRAALSISRTIQEAGYQALPIAASQVIDWEHQKGHVSHKALAVAAGHGWIGRNNLLIHPQYGAQVRLVTVLTNYPMLANAPLKENCGTCQVCITVCPARAIHEDRAQFDHKNCFETLRGFKTKANIGHYICGICVKACNGPEARSASRKPRQEGSFLKRRNSKRESPQ